MVNLFEYQNKVAFPDSFEALEEYLDVIWRSREKSSFYAEEELGRTESQQFVQFLHKHKEIKSNKYVGVIQIDGQRINLLPKVFHQLGMEYEIEQVDVIQKHILWWLSYCRKIKFPSFQASLGGLKSDFFEVLIYLFSKYTRTLLSSSIYQQYQEVNSELPFIKGRLDTNTYIHESVAKAKWHKLNCTYDAFVMDNKFNRILKHVSNLLFKNTSNIENRKNLREILFILDEVSDVGATAEDCAHIQFNPMFGEFETVRDYCYLFLKNSVSFSYKNDLKLFAFLLPMEYVFEDFVFGFIDKEMPEVKVKSQVSSKCLDVNGLFPLRLDLMLNIGERKVIADTKYKAIYSDEKDPKKGISQGDLYQMLAYAIRFKVDEVLLLYPNTVHGGKGKVSEIKIEDELADGRLISIKSFQLPILDMKLFAEAPLENVALNESFERLREELCSTLREILFTTQG